MHNLLKDSRLLVGRERIMFGRHVLMSMTDVLPHSSGCKWLICNHYAADGYITVALIYHCTKQQFAIRQWY